MSPPRALSKGEIPGGSPLHLRSRPHQRSDSSVKEKLSSCPKYQMSVTKLSHIYSTNSKDSSCHCQVFIPSNITSQILCMVATTSSFTQWPGAKIGRIPLPVPLPDSNCYQCGRHLKTGSASTRL